MEIRFDPSGAVTIVAGTHSHGQGHATVYAQMASSWLGIAFERIRLVQGDTDAVPIGRGTFAARHLRVLARQAAQHHLSGDAGDRVRIPALLRDLDDLRVRLRRHAEVLGWRPDPPHRPSPGQPRAGLPPGKVPDIPVLPSYCQ